MHERPFWIRRIEQAWERRRIAWLSGARRAGKTTLARMLPDAVYLNCDLPSVVRQLQDPEPLYESLPSKTILVLDEVHRLDDPSQVLKIAADAHPHLRILATGSSTLAATRKFRDALTGRKLEIYLAPVLWSECQAAFGGGGLDRRLLHGGLPEPLLAPDKDPAFFAEWLDSYYARDIQELFAIRDRAGFLRLLGLLLRQSGGLVEYTNLARLSELSRPTVKAHLEAMRVAHAVFLVPPFHGGGRREIVRRPRVYAFDTGFVTFAAGWDTIREEDRGPLWEHLVLDELRACGQERDLFFWRDKSGRAVDFVIRRMRRQIDAVECKVDPDRFDAESLLVFREHYPEGRNFVVSPHVKNPYTIRRRGLTIRICQPDQVFAPREAAVAG